MKRLVFCFDGTWNRIDAQHPTNVVITAESVLPLARDNVAQLIYYDEGVGTGRWDQFTGGVFGAGLLQNLADAYRFLIFNHTPGDEIYVFGFSRGAFSARSFVGLISCCGIMLRKDAGKVNDAIARYQERADTPAYIESMMNFRKDHSPDVSISAAEDEWRMKNIPGYTSVPRLHVTYLGVWDTVGALGVPQSVSPLSFLNDKYRFHDTMLSAFVRSARHAVAIDERRSDFAPTLWSNLAELNAAADMTPDAADAPYKQKWFPGVHSSVGGGGDRRGLSDQAMDWVMDGARHMGLELDSSVHSRIFELTPDYTEYLNDSVDPGALNKLMNKISAADREHGPTELFEVAMSARRRWHADPKSLRDGTPYRPGTLSAVAKALDALKPADLGLIPPPPSNRHEMYEVKRNDNLSKIAAHYYGNPNAWRRIYDANRNKLEDENHIYVGQLLRIPLD